jgi:hypothetical protein
MPRLPGHATETRPWVVRRSGGQPMTQISVTELREDLASEQARARRLEQELQRAEAEIKALRLARDAALKIAVWGGRRIEVDTRGEY